MVFSKHAASCDEARRIDLVSYLSSLGHEPAQIRNYDYWYLSPLRQEKTPSFKVNRRMNKWYDHGLGKGGNVIDFAILYNDCTVGEFLQMVGVNLSLHPPIPFCKQRQESKTETPIKLLGVKSLSSFVLLRYLHQRRVSVPVAQCFCKEVRYELNGRSYFSVGFKNNAGGYELRNALSKTSSAPKDITTIENGARYVNVFEGFFDFLSFKSVTLNQQQEKCSFLVLNSLSFFEKARPFMEKHECINLYLDRDKAGQNCTKYALLIGKKYQDKSALYNHYKDFNDWIVNIGKTSHDF